MEREQLVCRCQNIYYGQIVDAVNDGCTTYQQVFNRLHFGVGCGGCRSKIKQMIYLLNVEKRKSGNQ